MANANANPGMMLPGAMPPEVPETAKVNIAALPTGTRDRVTGLQPVHLLYVGLGVGALCIVIGFLSLLGDVSFAFRPGEDTGYPYINEMIDWLVLAGIVIMGPYGIYSTIKITKREKVEARLPDFLRDVAEAGRFGMTLPEAIIVASKGRYGLLTDEIKRMASQLEWGVPVSHALKLFEDRIRTPLTSRVVSIITKANEAGGNVADVLTMVAHDTREIQLGEEARRINMSTYLAVIYISFAVFLVTIYIMSATFLPDMVAQGNALASSGISGSGGAAISLGVQYVPLVFLAYFASVISHAVGDGIMAGVIHMGKIQPGLMHATIMLIIGWIFMRFLVPIL